MIVPDSRATTSWNELRDELDLWKQQNRVAGLWWRDDDAVEISPRLHLLRGLAARFRLPLALSVVPARASWKLSPWMRSWNEAIVIQHGLTHGNLAPVGAKKSEWSCEQTRTMLAELAKGRAILEQLFAGQFCPVLVPPWNRIAQEVVNQLCQIGFVAVSASYKTKIQAGATASRCRSIHVHIDPVDWPKREFSGAKRVLAELVAHLQILRCQSTGNAVDHPIGLLTHHLIMCQRLHRFLEQLFTLTCTHQAVRWLDLREIIATGGGYRQEVKPEPDRRLPQALLP